MSQKKKILTVITVFTDGTCSIIPPKETGAAANADTNDSIDEGGETPTKPPGSPQ